MMRVLFFIIAFFLLACRPTPSTPLSFARSSQKSNQNASLAPEPVTPSLPENTQSSTPSVSDDQASVALPYQDSEEVPPELIFMVEKIRGMDSSLHTVIFSAALSKLSAYLQRYNGKPIAPLTLVELAGQWGIASPWILQNTLISMGYDDNALAAWVAKNIAMYRTQHGVTHFGISKGKLSDGSDLVVLLMQRRRFSHAPFARWVNPGSPFLMNGRLEPGVTHLDVFVTAPDGSVARARVPLGENQTFSIRLDFCASNAQRGHYNVELLGKDEHGPFVAGLFPVACGQQAAFRHINIRFQEASGEMGADAFASAVFQGVNQHRAKLGMPVFRQDARLDTIAHAHSQEMCASKKIFHISPITGSPLQRVQRARLHVQMVAENVAMGASAEEIVGAWDKSEGHRLNMEHAKGTHAGIGVCRGTYGAGTIVYYVTLLIVAY